MIQQLPITLATGIRRTYVSIFLLGAVSMFGCSGSQSGPTSTAQTSDTFEGNDPFVNQTDESDSHAGTQHIQIELASHAELMKKVEGMRGHFVVLDIWSTNCPPCLEELPNLFQLANDPSLDVQCVSFNLDYIGLKNKLPTEYLKKVSAVLGQFQDSPAKHFLSTEKDFDVFRKFGISTIPAVFVYDRQGNQIFPTVAAVENEGTNEGARSFRNTEVSYERDIFPLLRQVAKLEEPAKDDHSTDQAH